MIISIHNNRQAFAYDIHSLVKAFYPGADVTIISSDSPSARNVSADNHVPGKHPDEKQTAGTIADDCSAGSFVSGKGEEGINPGSLPERERLEIETSFGACIRIVFKEPEGGGFSDSIPLDEGMDNWQIKNRLKRLLYEMLRGYSGRSLPWGNLTGIRPVKIAMEQLRQGADEEQIIAHMTDRYYVSRSRAELSAQIAAREKHILDGIQWQNGYSLYIGIPFCPSICLYCSFSSSPIGRWRDRTDEYIECLGKEIAGCAPVFSDQILNTVYIGGGTPTTLTAAQMDRLLSKIEESFDLGSVCEFTVEAGRPDTVSREILQVLKDHRVSRISVNPQTMCQETLDLIGRKHSADQTREAFRMARDAGFDNINMDVIIGLPGEGMEQNRYTMEELMKLAPDSVTVHSLALKRAARLNLMKDAYLPFSFRTSGEIMDMTAEVCRDHGLFPYYLYRQKNMAGNFENIGYAREGCEGLYNILFMEDVQSILALGAGGSTKIVRGSRIERVENVKDIANYIERIDEMTERKKEGYRRNI